nr:RNA-directed DNA polymerase, eukaryota, nucleotide-binding alpha-beta plait domain protein [Tanacetum cinerariifolium]
MPMICKNESFSDLKFHHVGGMWIWLQFSSSSSCSKFQDNAALKSYYSIIKFASPSFKVDERMIWIEISELPLCAWGSNAFKKVACLFGKFMFFEVDESTAMSSRRVCISTKSHNMISETINVEIHGESFVVSIHELGTWSTSILDNSLDSSSYEDNNDNEKVKENSDVDLKDLNDNLNNLVQELNEEEVKATKLSDEEQVIVEEECIKAAWPSLEFNSDGRRLASHEKLRSLKHFIKQWHANMSSHDRSSKQTVMRDLKLIDKKIDDGSASQIDLDNWIKIMQDLDNFDKFKALDLFKKRKKKMLISKVDFEKAFDSVSWKYPEFVLYSLGFGSKWRLWIKACLNSSRDSILINGSPTFEFSCKQGLRQGDPSRLFLFVLIMEGLHCAIFLTISSGFLRGIKFSSFDIIISHLFYADDKVVLIRMAVALMVLGRRLLVRPIIYTRRILFPLILFVFVWAVALAFAFGKTFGTEILLFVSASLRDLISNIEDVDLNMEEYSCMWALSSNGSFSVGDTRCLIDAKLFPSSTTLTYWDKVLPWKNWSLDFGTWTN